MLAKLRPSFPQFANMGMLDMNRRLVCTAVPTSVRTIPDRPGDSELAERIRKTRDFAVGDVRSGSVKRVGAAIGEGAAVVAQLHTFLSRRDSTADSARRAEAARSAARSA